MLMPDPAEEGGVPWAPLRPHSVSPARPAAPPPAPRPHTAALPAHTDSGAEYCSMRSAGHLPDLEHSGRPRRNNWVSGAPDNTGGLAGRMARQWKRNRLSSRESDVTREPRSQVPESPWTQFSDHLKLIGDDTQLFSPRKLVLRQSLTFSEVMEEIEAKKRAEQERLRQEEEEAARAKVTFTRSGEEERPRAVKKPVDKRALLRRAQAARRGWTLVRRAVQEIKMERQTQADLQWSFLKQTITNMTDMEKSRQEMYQKYIYKPNSWGEGIENFEEKLKKAIRERDEREREQRRARKNNNNKQTKPRPKSEQSRHVASRLNIHPHKPLRSVTSL